MSLQTWQETLITAQSDGSPLNTSTTPTSIIPAAAKLTLPANYFQIGKKLRVKAQGRVSNIVTTPGTLTFDFRLAGTVVFNGGVINLSTTAHTNVPWWLEFEMTCRSIGAAATLIGQGLAVSQAFVSGASADSVITHGSVLVPNTAPAVGTSFDSTASLAADLFATFSINNAANGVTLHQYSLEALN